MRPAIAGILVGEEEGEMRGTKTLVVCLLVLTIAAGGCGGPRRQWGKCARRGAVLGGIAGGLAGGLGVTEFEKNEVSTGEKAAGIGGGIAGGILLGALLGHFICDPTEEEQIPPPVVTKAPPPPAGKPLVTLHGPEFDFDKYALKPAGQAKVDEAVRVMKEHEMLRVSVEGHTDAVGTDAYNQKLSVRRAVAVRDYMIDHGIAADRLTAKGFGESRPAATNDTEAGRAENRRVEIIPLP